MVVAGLLVVGCGSRQVVVKPAEVPPPPEPSWIHLDRGPCPAPYAGGFCAVGRASGTYGSSLGIAAASAQARTKLAEWMGERLSARFVGDQGGISGSPGGRPRSIDTGRLHVETVTTAVVGGIAVPEWAFAGPVRPGGPSGGDYVALARVAEDQVRDARALVDQMQLDPEERQEALQAYDLFLDDLARERERALARTRR
jgi:hypothetical protein